MAILNCVYLNHLVESRFNGEIDMSIFGSLGFRHVVWSVTYVTVPRVPTVPWASYQIRKIAGCACAGNAGNVFPRRRFQRKPLVSDPDMHHGTCVTHVPWCMSGSLTCGNGENVPGIPGACAPGILRIWQEAHGHQTSLAKGYVHSVAEGGVITSTAKLHLVIISAQL